LEEGSGVGFCDVVGGRGGVDVELGVFFCEGVFGVCGAEWV
jgi:hypothetical protein